MACLLLSFRHLFNEHPGHIPACVRVSTFVATTLSYPESHSRLSLVNVTAVTFNVPVAVKIMVPAGSHVEYTVNWPRRAALGAIEGEIPAAAAAITSINPEVPSKVDMEGSVCEILHEFTVL